MFTHRILNTIIVFLLFSNVFSQQLHNDGYVPTDWQINWADAGLLEQPPVTTDFYIDVTKHDPSNPATPDDDSDDDGLAIQAAIDFAVSNYEGYTLIYIPEGEYHIYSPIEIKRSSYSDDGASNIIIQGEGDDETILNFEIGTDAHCFTVKGSGDGSADQIDLTSNWLKDTFGPINGNFGSSISANDWVRVCQEDFEDGYEQDDPRQYVGQIVQVQSVTPTQVNFKKPATKDYHTNNGSLWLSRLYPIKNVGIEDLKINRVGPIPDHIPIHDGEGQAIRVSKAVNCWIKGVQSYKSYRSHFNISKSAHILVSGCFINSAKDWSDFVWNPFEGKFFTNGEGYGILLNYQTNKCLIENNIFRELRHAIVFGEGANANVLAFNYFREQRWYEPHQGADICFHGRYPYANLVEQNMCQYVHLDPSHAANGPFNLIFRNYIYDDGVMVDAANYTSVVGNVAAFDHNPITLTACLAAFAPITTQYFFDCFGLWQDSHTIHHSAAAMGGQEVHCVLEDISYYYSQKPEFLTSNYSWPCAGAWVPGNALLSQENPAYHRWQSSDYTYNANSTLPPIQDSGELDYNQTWLGNITISADVIVPAGVTLIILPGTTIKFVGRTGLYSVYGSHIIAEGTESEPIEFTSQSGTSRTSRKPIYIYGGNNSFKHCIFKYSDNGLKLDANKPGDSSYRATGNVVENCTFIHNDQALRIQENTVAIKKCEIYNNRHAYVCYNNDGVQLSENYIHDNDREGIYSWSGNTIQLWGFNVLENNNKGIYSSNDDSIAIGALLNLPGQSIPLTALCCNTIRNNIGDEIYISGSPDFDIIESSIHDSDGYEVKASSLEYKMIECYHGGDTPSSSQYTGLYTAISPYSNPQFYEGQFISSFGKAIAKEKPEEEKKNKEDVEKLKNKIAEDNGEYAVKEALRDLYLILKADRVENSLECKDTFEATLREIYENTKYDEVKELAMRYLIFWLTFINKYDEAIILTNEALKTCDDEEYGFLLKNLACFYVNAGELKSAEKCLKKLQKKFSIDETGIAFVEEEITALKDAIEVKVQMEKDTKKLSPEFSEELSVLELSVSQNYPNPGNPSTSIIFNLPVTDDVSVKVFNMLGQEVRTLANKKMQAGLHTVVWDGMNNSGQTVASGLYIYTIQTSDAKLSKKLTILK